ncbi:FAD synthetase family protein [Rhizobium bangladeshense]|uniref:FAD synthetase family protein n=1 Tax=Rhizobium bangladeshense TaxID=1138189 RepID=UPI001C909065|nr:FAD synthetase family protein [Rhizobium bangladeshense]MBY3584323.1 FAD synthetase family protein [Rhizobium bangladeshense]
MDHHPGIHTQIHYDTGLTLSGSAVTIGAFDGVHSGHQALIRSTVLNAQRLGIPVVVYTFDPPPKTLLCGARPLTSIDEKVARISALGPDHIVVARFDAAYRSRTATDFIQDIGQIAPHVIWVGSDFRFGSCKKGTPEFLASYFDTRILPAVCCESGEVVSSTRIRALRDAGRFREAERLQGWSDLPPFRPYCDNGGHHATA